MNGTAGLEAHQADSTASRPSKERKARKLRPPVAPPAGTVAGRDVMKRFGFKSRATLKSMVDSGILEKARDGKPGTWTGTLLTEESVERYARQLAEEYRQKARHLLQNQKGPAN